MVFDEFKIKYIVKEHANNLIKVFKQYYKIENTSYDSIYCKINTR